KSAIDEKNGTVTFSHLQAVNITDYMDTLTLDVKFNNDPNHHLINKTKTISLNAMYNHKTGHTSNPNVTISKGQVKGNRYKFYCEDCYSTGNATISLYAHIGRHHQSFIKFSLEGDLKLNLDFFYQGYISTPLKTPSAELYKTGIPGLSIPDILTVGPEMAIQASAGIGVSPSIILRFGMDTTIALKYTVELIKENLIDNIFNIQNNVHTPRIDFDDEVEVTGYLVPQISAGIDILKIKYGTGVVFNSELKNKVFIGTNTGCEKLTTPKLSIKFEEKIDGFYKFESKKTIPLKTFPQ
ncbi:14315_t:CDS:1, partial [Acaulospora colombiana]